MTRRHTASLKRLGTERCAAFLRAARGDDRPLAVKFANEHLDAGGTIESLFGAEDSSYSLHVKRLGPLRFRIAFRCVPGPMVGDGGEWEVEFDDEGRVVTCFGDVLWMS